MLEIDVDFKKGILFIRLGGILNKETIGQFENELNYLFSKQGNRYFIFDFNNIERIEFDIVNWLERKLIDFYLSCGKVILYGLDKYENKINKHDKLFYMKDKMNLSMI